MFLGQTVLINSLLKYSRSGVSELLDEVFYIDINIMAPPANLFSHDFCLFVCLMVFNATFNNISVISYPMISEIIL
jgi:hypothetical protein